MGPYTMFTFGTVLPNRYGMCLHSTVLNMSGRLAYSRMLRMTTPMLQNGTVQYMEQFTLTFRMMGRVLNCLYNRVLFIGL